MERKVCYMGGYKDGRSWELGSPATGPDDRSVPLFQVQTLEKMPGSPSTNMWHGESIYYCMSGAKSRHPSHQVPKGAFQFCNGWS